MRPASAAASSAAASNPRRRRRPRCAGTGTTASGAARDGDPVRPRRGPPRSPSQVGGQVRGDVRRHQPRDRQRGAELQRGDEVARRAPRRPAAPTRGRSRRRPPGSPARCRGSAQRGQRCPRSHGRRRRQPVHATAPPSRSGRAADRAGRRYEDREEVVAHAPTSLAEGVCAKQHVRVTIVCRGRRDLVELRPWRARSRSPATASSTGCAGARPAPRAARAPRAAGAPRPGRPGCCACSSP